MGEDFFKMLRHKGKFFVHMLIQRPDGTEGEFSDFYTKEGLKEVYEEFMVPNEEELRKVSKVKIFQIYADFTSLTDDPIAYESYLKTMQLYTR
jgi:hypothetical protein